MLRPVEVCECSRHHAAVRELCRINHWLKKSPPHDLETLLRSRGTQRGFDPTDHVAELVEGLASSLTPNFYIVGLRVRRNCGVRGR